VAFSGDLLPHLPVDAQAAAYGRASGRRYDFGPMLSPMRPILEAADVAICHLEVPLTPDGVITGYPSFGAPRELADAIKGAGFDGCSTASNHSLDRGRAGVQATLETLDRVGLKHAGTARNPWDSGPAIYNVRGVEIRHLSYAYGFNGYRVPAEAPWTANQIDVARIRRDAAAARKAGAEIVVVSLHWGTEYQAVPDGFQRSVAAALLPSPDIDLLIGHHAHVVQPIQVVEGTYVVWGMGNQLSNQTQLPRRDGLTVLARFGLGWDLRWHVSGIQAVPTWVDLGSFRVLPVAHTLKTPGLSAAMKAVLEGSFFRTAGVVGSGRAPGIRYSNFPN
jgi:poly-gamma-glutamate synthesis protein (capsule biosynthesis protein)